MPQAPHFCVESSPLLCHIPSFSPSFPSPSTAPYRSPAANEKLNENPSIGDACGKKMNSDSFWLPFVVEDRPITTSHGPVLLGDLAHYGAPRLALCRLRCLQRRFGAQPTLGVPGSIPSVKTYSDPQTWHPPVIKHRNGKYTILFDDFFERPNSSRFPPHLITPEANHANNIHGQFQQHHDGFWCFFLGFPHMLLPGYPG